MFKQIFNFIDSLDPFLFYMGLLLIITIIFRIFFKIWSSDRPEYQ